LARQAGILRKTSAHRHALGRLIDGFTLGHPSQVESERLPKLLLLLLLLFGTCIFAAPAYSQIAQEETLGGPDSHETGQGPHGHLFGEWGGERSRLLEHGVRFDLQYVSDSLWNIKSEQKERFASWNRFRWTVDIDFGELVVQRDLVFHATALWQGGGNLGAYLGLLTSPSGMSSMNTTRLDSWWIEKRWLDERITARIEVPSDVRALSEARNHESVKLGEVLCARSIEPFEGGCWRLRRMRANGWTR